MSAESFIATKTSKNVSKFQVKSFKSRSSFLSRVRSSLPLLMNSSFSMQSRTSTRDCRTNVARMMSSMQTQLPGSLHDYQVDPYRLLEDDLKDVYDNIREVS